MSIKQLEEDLQFRSRLAMAATVAFFAISIMGVLTWTGVIICGGLVAYSWWMTHYIRQRIKEAKESEDV